MSDDETPPDVAVKRDWKKIAKDPEAFMAQALEMAEGVPDALKNLRPPVELGHRFHVEYHISVDLTIRFDADTPAEIKETIEYLVASWGGPTK